MKKYYCIECGASISRCASVYGKERCKPCSSKGKNNPMFGRILTFTEKQKIGLSVKKAMENPEIRKKISDRIITDEYRKKISLTKTGTTLTEEHKHKISLNNTRPMLGRNHTDKTKNKISMANSGKNNGRYIHGLSLFPYPLIFNNRLKTKIKKQYNYTCQYCGITEEEHLNQYKQGLHIHHIDYNKKNCKPSNLIPTCQKDNLKANFNRDYWYAYYTYIKEKIQ